MQQPPPNYYGSPYPPSYPNKPNYPGNNPGTPYPNNVPPDYPVAGKETPPPSNTTTIDNDVGPTYVDLDNLPRQKITVYATFPDSAIWHDRVFKGNLILSNNQFMTIYDEETKTFTTIVGVYINFVEYTDPILINRTQNS